MEAAIQQKTGMGAVACAAASGDAPWRTCFCLLELVGVSAGIRVPEFSVLGLGFQRL